MPDIDTAAFLWLTAAPLSAGWVVRLALILASAVVPLVIAGLLAAWVRARSGWRPALLDAVAAGVLGLGCVQVIGWIHYRPRPFEAGLGANLLGHLPENSFPSDHATLMFALAFAFVGAAPLRLAGLALLALALSVGWARIFLGAHYPSDILGGAVLALLSVGLVTLFPGRARLWSFLNRLYEALLIRLHMPQSLLPRGR